MEEFERRFSMINSPLKVEPDEISYKANDIFSPPKTTKTTTYPSPEKFVVPSVLISPPRSPPRLEQLSSPSRTVKT